VATFTTIGSIPEISNTVLVDGQRFRNAGISLDMLVPQIAPFRWRRACAQNLRSLRSGLRAYVKAEGSYPPSGTWYDAIVYRYEAGGYTTNVAKMASAIKCPATSHGQSHYAMNPSCTPGSPADTVLLFEAKTGWNQHGGPEMFMFEHHEPRGGLVLLNGGTVKFIRTEEELKQLRWE
jgi:hypothetical protein